MLWQRIYQARNDGVRLRELALVGLRLACAMVLLFGPLYRGDPSGDGPLTSALEVRCFSLLPIYS